MAKEQMPATPACQGLDRIGEFTKSALQLPKGLVAVDVIVHVHIKHNKAGPGASRDADVCMGETFPPVADRRFVRAGVLEAVLCQWFLGPILDREHLPAVARIGKRGI